MPSRSIPILRARIENGKVQWIGISGKQWDVSKRAMEGAEVEITIRKRPKKSTPPQRRYYWSVIIRLICESVGYAGKEEEEGVHEELKRRFLSVQGNELLPIVRSTESLTTAEREEYHENCRRFAAEHLQLYIPLPNEVALL